MPGKPLNRDLNGKPNKLTLTVQNLPEIRLSIDAENQNIDPASLAAQIVEEHYKQTEVILQIRSEALASAVLRGLTLEQYLRGILTDRFPGWQPSWRKSPNLTAELIAFSSGDFQQNI